MIPEGAICEGDEYIITQSFPLLCANTQRYSDYKPICVKDYHESYNRSFSTHVQIIAYFTTKLDSKQIQVRFNKQNEMYIYEEAANLKQTNRVTHNTDVYFYILDNKVIIFTKHFTVFIIEKKIQWESLVRSNCPNSEKDIYLLVCAYLTEIIENNTVLLKVFIRDNQENNDAQSNETNFKDANVEPKYCCILETPLKNLPDVIWADTTFQCVIAITEKQQWKKLMSNFVSTHV